MPNLRHFEVVPALAPQLEPLLKLAKNLWWSWYRPARDLFARIDPELYERVAQNPLALLARAPQRRLSELAEDKAYLAEMADVVRALDAYLTRETWFDRNFGQKSDHPVDLRVAYFSMEFGIHDSLPVYSGGLGVLAGDHLKSASDLGIPVVGVGIAFSQGYFRQALDADGWQAERYPPNDWHDLPVSPVVDGAGNRVIITVALPAAAAAQASPTTKPAPREVALQAWRVEVGRVPLLLLDANLEQNTPEERALTNTLYGGDRAHRIRQEILLGVGGVKMVAALGIQPTVCHMNEGHSAFLALERVRQLMVQQGAPFVVAREVAAAGNVFTTHTPVPAGNDAFPAELIAPYLEVLGTGLGMTAAEVQRLGTVSRDGRGEFSMPVLAIRIADHYNGVSVLHGREARAMWHVLWPEIAENEVPIGSITNGVHLATWVSREFAEVFDRHLGPEWSGEDAAVWQRLGDIPDEIVWKAHERCRSRLADELDHHVRLVAQRKGLPEAAAKAASAQQPRLDPNALTIGFARRFATYKRGALLLRDPGRLHRILSRADRPVQLLFSGKAHPQDHGGKELIQAIVRASMSDAFRGRIVFLEDYDMAVARALVAGVDVWLNTPRRPLEASGTSGMKAALNGALNASILDGWWCEAYAGDNGFAIGHGEEYADAERGDRVEAESLYRLLEDEVVPMFYDRDASGLPRKWIGRMKRSIASIAPIFNTGRMVREYMTDLYAPAARRVDALVQNGLAGARAVTEQKARLVANWPAVKIESVATNASSRIVIGRELGVVAEVSLGTFAPSDVLVELYYGKLDGGHVISGGAATSMRATGELGSGRYRFEGAIAPQSCGEHAFAVRIVPNVPGLADRFATRLVTWS